MLQVLGFTHDRIVTLRDTQSVEVRLQLVHSAMLAAAGSSIQHVSVTKAGA
jgi:hypothetical protein